MAISSLKRCYQCRRWSSLDNFAKANTRLEKYQAFCRPCGNAMGRQNYQDNKERYKRLAQIRTADLWEMIDALKDVPCTDCGVRYPPYVMDFDHLDGSTKEFNISYMRRHRMAKWKILAEVKKCEVVCSNCHRLRSWARATAHRAMV